MCRKNRDIREAVRLRERHREVYLMISKLKNEQEVLIGQKEDFWNEMTALRQRTRELELQIRDTCGYEGKAWFSRIEANTERIRLGESAGM
jgi:hypothetical protein